jgi:hypothetical protein
MNYKMLDGFKKKSLPPDSPGFPIEYLAVHGFDDLTRLRVPISNFYLKS